MIRSWFTRWFTGITRKIDWRIGWYRLPVLFGLLELLGMRILLRQQNLYDTSAGTPTEPPAGAKDRCLKARTADGTYNDLDIPTMGSAGTRFGRNVPLQDAYPGSDEAILTPNPRVISRELLARDSFVPATTLNLLAAAWIQFMIHDWFSHGKNDKENKWLVPLAEDDPWPQRPMQIIRTHKDPTHTADSPSLPPTFLNTETHWWDGSQIYGSDATTQAKMRAGEDGKLKFGPDGLLPLDPETGTDIAGVNGNWWVGLSLMHTLFTREHNAICDRLRAEYPSWSDDDLFNHARLVNVALMAKIHTIEWTPAILAHPTLRAGMNGNWWGLASKWVYEHFGRISKSEVLSGIPGSPKDHFGVPYSLTEEFVSVYRMHPLLPDEISFRSVTNDTQQQNRSLPDLIFQKVRTLQEQVSMTDLFYSFGTSHPGAITLHNYPRFLQELHEPDGSIIDLATTEIIRDRERGVPRYNAFRKLLHRPPLKSFEELTDNKAWVEELRRIYGNDIDKLDLMVGLYSETCPKGFGFSDTAFRIFILMASRRLNSDRFFTTDYNPQVYTPIGFRWIIENDMSSILRRHYPDLSPSLRNVTNTFAPWPRAAG
ncbi:MAG TPA: peroxidase family protein [Chthonomonadaceae bacterium]|nr:peroxidase family protein [Chthonomonadaceae bacterium]